MSITLNEHEWAREMILTHSIGKKPFETLTRVARYYIDEGLTKVEARDELDRFLLSCDPTASLTKWSDSIDLALNQALKHSAVEIPYISITLSEMAKISTLNGIQLQRLAFTLLCLAKYWDCVSPARDHWVNNKDSEIMSMANINTSVKRQSELYHQLNQLGLIQFSKKIDNTNVRVLFGNADGEDAVKITDFRNLGYQYMKASGSDDFFVCECCGVITKKNKTKTSTNAGRPQKYCPDCAIKINIKRNVESVMARRSKSKN